MGSHSQRIARYDLNGSFLGYWIGDRYHPSHRDSYDYLHAFAIDATHDRIYIAMGGAHRVRAFSLSTGEMIWNAGNGHSGDLKEGRYHSPYDVELLPNGNVLVCCRKGRGQQGDIEAIGDGHITELNGETGELIACRLMYQPNTRGEAWANACANPEQARILDDGLLYVSMTNHDHVGVWNPETWEYVKSYTKPAGVDIARINPRGITLNTHQDELIIVANSPKMIVALGLTDNDYKWHVGQQRWDDKTSATNRIGEFQDICDVLCIGDDLYAVADYGNNRVMIVGNKRYLDIPYNITIPDGYEIVHPPANFNIETSTLRVRIEDIHNVGVLRLLIQAKQQQ